MSNVETISKLVTWREPQHGMVIQSIVTNQHTAARPKYLLAAISKTDVSKLEAQNVALSVLGGRVGHTKNSPPN